VIHPQFPVPSAVDPPARAVIAVASGKGGVGKSTVALNLAVAMADGGASVGLLDADFYGPDVPVMANLTRTRPARRWSLWEARGIRLEPVERFGVKLMSVGFLLAEGQVFPGAAGTLAWVARQLLGDVDWGDLDYLVVDFPPGTGDLQRDLLAATSFTGAIVVVTPQDVAHLDAKKLVSMLGDAGVPVLGGIENMRGLRCPHCGEAVDVFPAAAETRTIWGDGVPLLGTLPLEPAIAEAAERGRPGAVEAFRLIAERVAAAVAWQDGSCA
jgi:ATP-binding protein involved in chromosome partitioning